MDRELFLVCLKIPMRDKIEVLDKGCVGDFTCRIRDNYFEGEIFFEEDLAKRKYESLREIEGDLKFFAINLKEKNEDST